MSSATALVAASGQDSGSRASLCEPCPAVEKYFRDEEIEESRSYPLVSCVCPTMERRHKYHAALYHCFDSQSWPQKQLVVIDTGHVPSPFFSELEDARVVYVHREGADTDGLLGEKRNAAIEMAKGEVIAHFDDDDLYAPCYLDTMVEILQRSGREVCKLKAWYTVDTETGRCGHFDGAEPLPGAADQKRQELVYSYGFSIIHTKQVWRTTPYPEVNWGEDQGFLSLLKLKGNKIAFFRDTRCICLHVQHGKNASRSVCHKFVDWDFIMESPIVSCIPAWMFELLKELQGSETTHRGMFVCDLDASGVELDVKTKAVLKQWVGLEFSRWMKDPTVGSAQKELQGALDTEAHRNAQRTALVLQMKRTMKKTLSNSDNKQ